MNNQHTESTHPTARLREAPATRFEGPDHAFDLAQLSAQLQAEEHPGTNGHRQMTIFRRDATTIVLFAFESGGKLADHSANGLVTIQVLDGALTVEVRGETGEGGEIGWKTHTLCAQGILVLSPGVLHSVAAHAASRMLLTVHLEKGAATPT